MSRVPRVPPRPSSKAKPKSSPVRVAPPKVTAAAAIPLDEDGDFGEFNKAA
ncbi:MAG TPA: hypothetical protein VGN72_15280 [Tepidisphaeraceae bacterium]|jgi:hypothetical protein|nr:hypothetical protein [Tepidisphaeraceae bacterium]